MVQACPVLLRYLYVHFASLRPLSLLLLALLGWTSCRVEGAANGMSDAELESFRGSARVEKLLASMTLEDKVGEMTQLTLDMLCVGDTFDLEEPHRLDSNKLFQVFGQARVGSVLNSGGHGYPPAQWRALVSGIQQASLQAKGIPALYGGFFVKLGGR